uniref:Acyltransferase n=1 Tax=Chromera velia CCMP2878 TaxID=1169474 RepID=A0A0G4H3J2_9ALVE|mmetsp:Transcript_49404/g.97334  ORF Transcript_49404/g.97334 Transcript_49404/m.97334 type:complete len:376 (-) Transcript_49404:68-1195(-)|eukprot:Cvel_24530.t1-p1 / transcript=Cvel_24530.t1 / gene=Cvel_24530 / organism=Chromera_velia_CCMP2878 / gene_product=Diacylglycerol O-acyltransferase 2, putative / transcript_product=Diacylglycerol O-acyltransferase 2, putative / location=Cvel_scaffold2662:17596-19934(+) / protein_length=375 / sequence_SO=supercontig / SO=protein_coding / is_pseudo=false
MSVVRKSSKECDECFRCLELFSVPPSLASGTGGEGSKDHQAVEALVKTSQKPFEKNELASLAPLSLFEEAMVLAFLFITMGMPLFWFFVFTPYVVIFSSLATKVLFALTTLGLATHPLPKIPHEQMRKSPLVFALYKYFSYRFVWKGRLHEKIRKVGPWLGAGAPHGVLPFANLLSMAGINSFSFLPGTFKGAPATVVFSTPFLRYLFLLGPACDVSAKSLERELAKGSFIGLVPDGIAGIFKCSHTSETVYLKNRKGLARLALKTGYALLPAYSMGNTEAFTPWFDPFGLMEWASRKAQASLFFYTGRFGLPLGIPRRTRITMLVGEPVLVQKKENPSPAEIDEVHEELLKGIRECFDLHKDSLGWGHKQMKFV